jgi:hypothetical protein
LSAGWQQSQDWESSGNTHTGGKGNGRKREKTTTSSNNSNNNDNMTTRRCGSRQNNPTQHKTTKKQLEGKQKYAGTRALLRPS